MATNKDIQDAFRRGAEVAVDCMRRMNGKASVRPFIVARVTAELVEIGGKLHYLAEKSCNYGQTPRDERRWDGLVERGKELAAELGAELYVQGDPRGRTVWLIFPGDLRDGQTADSCYTSGVCVW